MKAVMYRVITVKSISVLTLVLLVVLGPSFVKVIAKDPEPGGAYPADDIVANIIAEKLHASISLHSVEADIAAIEEHMDLYALGLTTGDLDLWMSLYTEDTVKFAPDASAVFGKEALRASMEPLFEAFTFEEMDIFDVEIQLAGDYAFARCNFTATMIPKGGGEPTYMDGKDISIMQRQVDGSWKLHWDCWNSNVPLMQQ